MTTLENRIASLHQQLQVLESLRSNIVDVDVFTKEEVDGLDELKKRIQEALKTLENSVSRRDTVLGVGLDSIRSKLQTRERILNNYSQWVDLFEVFKPEHMRLIREKEQHESEMNEM